MLSNVKDNNKLNKQCHEHFHLVNGQEHLS